MKNIFRLLGVLALLAMPGLVAAQSQPNAESRSAGVYYAQQYSQWGNVRIASGTSATGAATIVVGPATVALPDGRVAQLFYPGILNQVLVGVGSDQETVTPTTVSVGQCPVGFSPSQVNCANITATFSNTHPGGEPVNSGSAGLSEAIVDAAYHGGGLVMIDAAWNGTNPMITAAPVFPNVAIQDNRSYAVQYWTPQGGATTIATPTTLTAVTALPSATPVGAFGTGTYHMCISYVDVMGQEGPCSADFSEAGLATGSFIFSPPAASAGAVGYTIYIGLTGGGVTNLNYKVPLVTQPTVVGVYPVSNGVCTLTQVETTTPACAVTNTGYNQTGATATVTAITLATSPVQPYSSTVSTTAITLANAGGRTTYAYTPGMHIGTPGMPASFLAFPVSGSAATTVPTVVGTIDLPPGFMNYLGRTIEVCGRSGITTGSTTTIANIIFQWSAFGQDNAGLPVVIGRLAVTPATAFATTEMDNFCEDFQTTVTSASATGGSINTTGGFIATSGVAAAAAGQAAGGDALTGATGSLNLANEARIDIVYTHTTGTFAPTLQNLSVKVVN